MDAGPRPTWRLQWANDALLDSDNQFTNGFAIQKSSAVTESLEETQGTPAFGKALARHLLPRRSELFFRETWSLAQDMQTPNAKDRAGLIVDDVPYLGLLGVGNTFIAFNDHELSAFELMLGWVGPSARAEDVQHVIHKINGSAAANGWQHQLDEEPIVNLFLTKKRKIWDTGRFDGAFSLDAALGNLLTMGQAALEMRFGRLPRGFAPLPTPVGRGTAYDGRLPMAGGRHVYGSLSLGATLFLHALPRNGNVLTRDNPWTQMGRIRPRENVEQLIVGVHLEDDAWALHLDYWLTSDTFGPGPQSGGDDRDNSFGALSFEWRLD